MDQSGVTEMYLKLRIHGIALATLNHKKGIIKTVYLTFVENKLPCFRLDAFVMKN